MNGIHDMGGMHGMGPIEYEKDEPVFHHDWRLGRMRYRSPSASEANSIWTLHGMP